MTDLRQAAQMALEALENCVGDSLLGGQQRRAAIEALRSALSQQGEQGEQQPDNDEVICPNCCHQFRAIPANVQRLMLDVGFEPPFTAAPAAQPDADPNAPWMTEAHHLCTDHGIPQGNLTERIRALRDKLAQQGEQQPDVLAEYTRTDGRRQWESVGAWLLPGEQIAVISAAAAPAAQPKVATEGGNHLPPTSAAQHGGEQ